jgi:hypothetical protein
MAKDKAGLAALPWSFLATVTVFGVYAVAERPAKKW